MSCCLPRLVDHPAGDQTSAICAACEPTASTIETMSGRRYGRRKPSRRTNVARYGTASSVRVLSLTSARELRPDECERAVEPPRFAGTFGQLLAPDGWGSGIDGDAVVLEALADRNR